MDKVSGNIHKTFIKMAISEQKVLDLLGIGGGKRRDFAVCLISFFDLNYLQRAYT